MSQMCFESFSILATAMSNWTNSVANLFWQPLYTKYIGKHCILVTAVYWQPLYIGKHCIMETAVYWQALYIGNYSIMSIMATTVYRQLLCQTEPFRPQICTGNYSTVQYIGNCCVKLDQLKCVTPIQYLFRILDIYTSESKSLFTPPSNTVKKYFSNFKLKSYIYITYFFLFAHASYSMLKTGKFCLRFR